MKRNTYRTDNQNNQLIWNYFILGHILECSFISFAFGGEKLETDDVNDDLVAERSVSIVTEFL